MGRGCLPADHELCFSRARGKGLKEADVALVIGVPLDFRLGFGGSFGEETKLIWLDEAPNELTANRRPELELVGGIAGDAGGDARGRGRRRRQAPHRRLGRGAARDRGREARGRAGELNDDRAPLHPLRIYKELDKMLDRDAIVIGDGGDFVSYAGRVMNTYEPGCWMDPGPYGCLGAGPGQAIGAKTAHPNRQVVCLLGDGAFGFSGLEFDTMARHNLPVVGIIGNNGIWALEYHPMKFLYGYQVAAELRPATRYDEVVKALGGHGELVRHPSELQPALERAFASGKPALVNVLTDPETSRPAIAGAGPATVSGVQAATGRCWSTPQAWPSPWRLLCRGLPRPVLSGSRAVPGIPAGETSTAAPLRRASPWQGDDRARMAEGTSV